MGTGTKQLSRRTSNLSRKLNSGDRHRISYFKNSVSVPRIQFPHHSTGIEISILKGGLHATFYPVQSDPRSSYPLWNDFRRFRARSEATGNGGSTCF